MIELTDDDIRKIAQALSHLADPSLSAVFSTASNLILAHARTLAKLRVATAHLENAMDAIDKGNIYQQMCCDGHMCGCQGSTHADEILHFGRASLTQIQDEKP